MSSIGLRRNLVNKLLFRMSSTKPSYEDAVHKLNLLQSNKAAIEQIRIDIKTGQKCTNLENMENYLSRSGVSLNLLDQLSVIHVAGTKGKGSTSAMCESILREHGYKTGFYSSPHLIAVRERIRLAGLMLTESQFAEHFDRVYDALYRTQAYDGDMPKYFAFLTVLAYNVFLSEKVDVAIVEVGIGGTVDYTNVLRKVPVVGITALGLDHTSILGNTLPEIAAAKSGIMKPACQAYTVQQPPEAMQVLRTVADNTQCTLNVVPEYESYTFQNGYKLLQVELEAYRMNSSLAIQLAHAWLRHKQSLMSDEEKNDVNDHAKLDEEANNKLVKAIPKETVYGLNKCKWPGRYHIVEKDRTQYYLDGAHTGESMEICSRWFQDNCRSHQKILVFSATGDRDTRVLLSPLKNIAFNIVFFVIPTAYKDVDKKCDSFSIMEHKDLISRCQNNAQTWKDIRLNSNKDEILVLECVSDAIEIIQKMTSDKSVLITGSLHLVGAALSILDPKIS